MSDVFISYKAEDRRRIQPLVQALQADGYSVWWDEHIGTGDEWRHTIEQQLDTARCVIVIWSKGSVGPEGHFVRDEASRAQRRHVYVPLLIDAVSPPLGFGESQATSLKGWKGDRSDHRYQTVLSAVGHIAGPASAAAPPQPMHQTPVSRRAVMAGGGVAALAIAGIGAWELLKPSSASAAGGIAVLPFANLSGDPNQAYFSDGLAEEIRSALTRLPGLKVIGRSSSDAVRNDDAQTAAKKLDVASILTGSVRQSPSTIRVTAELIDGRTGVDKWSQDYDRSPGDTIKIQTDIAENVASALGTALGQAARAAVVVGGTSNAAAQDLYLKAKAQLHADDSEQSVRTALGLTDSALTLDPKFADAYALKSRLLGDLNGYYLKAGTSYGPGYVRAAAVARQAISLAPNLAAGHTALAYILLSQLDIGGAAAEYQRSHALAGGDADDLLSYSEFLDILGKADEAIDIARQAQANDPLNAGPYASEASAQLNAGRSAQATAAYQKALSLAPNRLIDRAFLGAALIALGKFDEARTEFNKLPPDYLFRLVGESILFARQGNLAASDAALNRVQQINGDEANYQYAEIYTQRGEKDKAFEALDRAWTFRDPGLAYMYHDAWLRPLERGSPLRRAPEEDEFPDLMSDVFVSYKAEDRRRVQPLVEALQADGYSVWWDEHIGAGDAWRETIEQQLDQSRCVIVMWSKRSIGPDGRFVRDEASRALKRGAYVPVLLDNVDPPLGFGESQAISLRGWHGDRSDPHYQAVLAAIQRETGIHAPAPPPRSQLRVDRRTAIAGAGVAAVAVAGVGAWTLLKPASAGASTDSIAVLPFDNLSGDPAQAYFSDGVADEIRSSLARIAGLKVAGSTSSKAVRNDDAKNAAKKLGVGNILTGSVRQSPSTIRIAAELIDGRTGLDKWSQDYDRQPGDSIKIQTDIAENVATALSTALRGAARAAISVGGTSNAQAHDLFLRAAAPARESSKMAAQESLQLLNEAIRLDPNYADAYARKAMVIRRLTDAFSTNSAQFDSGRAQALQVAQTAARLAPGLAMAHVALGQVYRSGLHVGSASAELQRALELAPGDADALRTYSYFVSLLGDQSKALTLAERAIGLDPLNGSSYDNKISILFNARRYADAINAGLELKRTSPELVTFPTTLGDCFMMAGKIDESRQAYAAAPADDLFRLTGEAILAARTGDASGARGKLARIQQVSGDAASYQYGEIYAQLGAADEAFGSLEHAWQIKDAGLLHLRVDPWMDQIRPDPRFTALVGRIDFPPA